MEIGVINRFPFTHSNIPMVSDVFTLIFKEIQIIRFIIQFVSINMMDDFSRFYWSSNYIGCYKFMFKNISPLCGIWMFWAKDVLISFSHRVSSLPIMMICARAFWKFSSFTPCAFANFGFIKTFCRTKTSIFPVDVCPSCMFWKKFMAFFTFFYKQYSIAVQMFGVFVSFCHLQQSY